MKHYHVISGMGGGYMPNSNEVYSTKAAAQDAAKWHADEWRELIVDAAADGEKYRVQGNKREGYVLTRDSPYDLGEYIEIIECTEEGCEDCDD